MATVEWDRNDGSGSPPLPSLPLCRDLTLGHCVGYNGASYLASHAEFGHIEDWLSIIMRF